MKTTPFPPDRLSALLIVLALVNFPSSAASAKAKAAPQAPASAASAVMPQTRTLTVREITFRGLQTVKEAELLKSLPVKVNDRITVPGQEIPGVLQYLWNLQYFSNIQIEQTDLGSGSIKLTFVVTEFPLLESVEFQGNHKFKTKELLNTANLNVGRRVSSQELLNAENRIEKQYAAKGYLTAGAEYRLQSTGDNRVKAVFTIQEGNKVVIEKIRFHGNAAFKEGKLRGVLKETTQNSWWRKIFGQPKLDKDKFEEDKNLLVEFYRDNGYRDAHIVKDTITYTDDKKGLILDIYVEEGPKYHIRNISWSGNNKDFATTDILNATFGIKNGDLYSAKKINERLNFSQDHSDVSSLYLDRGYLSFRAQLEEQVVQPNQVDLVITLTEGDPYALNIINIKGNTKTKDHVIRRELYTVPGDTFSRKNVVRSIRELSMLNYFDPETLTPDIQPNQKNDTVDLTYNVTERQTDTFNAAIGYSGSSGGTGSLGLTFNNFSFADLFNPSAYRPLPHGDGQRLAVQWQFGSNNYRTLSLSASDPWAFGTHTSLGFTAFKTKQSYDLIDDGVDETTKTIDQYGANITIGRRLTWPDDYFAISWRLGYLHTKGGFVSFLNETGVPEEAEEFSITQTISRNSIDNPIYPRHGSKNVFTAQIAGGVLPGTINFYKLIGTSSWFFPVSRDLIVNVSAQQGYLDTFSEDDYIPYTNYFYMGGSGMSSLPTVPLRGYPDHSLGQQFDGETDLYGGKIYSKFTTELRYPLTLSPSASIYALVFAEAGNLWADASSFDLTDLKKSAGIGLRLYLPIIGQIGIDYGYGFDAIPSEPDKGAQGWNFTFSFGQPND
ncbi:outer membrane protein assembly factor BamA [Chlorobaculum thiosulfatiphilum]|uniref:Outer membrane protein assembly factor BamA n=1 Tax=Chlorobaculum thiosulfatiphilum TaxID=115852 RepID=A0A5C4S8N5_CHLTI|nr:outer membrane protein assembly factor BamA [Chlorobaculum thiosulfatiphilum]TNJ39111.1 outer membrane protein assembly factor BamA [Chlorobaculum thiosulfatiphilum]